LDIIMHRIRVLLTHEHDLVRASVKYFLESLSIVDVVAEARTAADALPLFHVHTADVLLILALPQFSSFNVIQETLQRHPAVRVLIVAMETSEDLVIEGLRSGVTGYLHGEAGLQELEHALRTIVRGGVYLSPAISQDGFRRRRQGSTAEVEKLTPRQLQVLQLIAEGFATREIAKKLQISVRTVETHRFQLMERLNIRNIAGLVRFAVDAGVVKGNR
jgi:DNA-binding NarL/FixJ family response regulator